MILCTPSLYLEAEAIHRYFLQAFRCEGFSGWPARILWSECSHLHKKPHQPESQMPPGQAISHLVFPKLHWTWAFWRAHPCPGLGGESLPLASLTQVPQGCPSTEQQMWKAGGFHPPIPLLSINCKSFTLCHRLEHATCMAAWVCSATNGCKWSAVTPAESRRYYVYWSSKLWLYSNHKKGWK